MKSEEVMLYSIGTTRSGVIIKIPKDPSNEILQRILVEWEKNQGDTIDVYSVAEYLNIWFLRHPSPQLHLAVQKLSNALHPIVHSEKFRSDLLAMNLRVSADFVRLGEALVNASFRS